MPKSFLLSIVELGGYPDFCANYKQAGYDTEQVSSMRKAISTIRKRTPDVIVAEFNFQSDFRDRTSSLESLMATLQSMAIDPLIVVLYEKEFAPHFKRLQDRFTIHYSLFFPVTGEDIVSCLSEHKE